MQKIVLATLLSAFLPANIGAQTASPPTQRIRGDVIALDGLNLQVKSRSGESLTVKLADSYTVNAVVKIGIERVVPGSYVGIASMPRPDGTQRAIEVLLFPEARRGSGEGHYPWDTGPDSSMTNATVAEVASNADGRTVQLKYKGGEAILDVPAATPIVAPVPGDASLVVVGKAAIAFARKGADGNLTAAYLSVEKDGVKPPM